MKILMRKPRAPVDYDYNFVAFALSLIGQFDAV
jgi:hypothetical protein